MVSKGRTATVVLGMHRSGTSALAGTIARCGAAAPATPMKPQPDNPKGFWESRTLSDLDEHILQNAGLAWDEPGIPHETFWQSRQAKELTEHFSQLLDAEFGKSPLFVLKDPRLSRLLPVLHEVFQRKGIHPIYLIALRHPFEIAASLHLRNGTRAERALLLWMEHLLAAERGTRGQPRKFINYRELLERPVAMLEAISAEFDLSWPLPLEKAGPKIREFLSDSDRHHRFGSGGAPQHVRLRGVLQDLWLAGQRVTSGDAFDPTPFDQAWACCRAWVEEEDPVEGCGRRALMQSALDAADFTLFTVGQNARNKQMLLESANEEQSQLIDRLTRQRDEEREARVALDEQLRQLKLEWQQKRDDAELLRDELADSERKLEGLKKRKDAAEKERRELMASVAELRSELELLQAEPDKEHLAEREGEVGAGAKLEATEAEREALRQELELAGRYARKLEAEVDYLRSRASRTAGARARRRIRRAGGAFLRRIPLSARMKSKIRRRFGRSPERPDSPGLGAGSTRAVTPESYRAEKENALANFLDSGRQLQLPSAEHPRTSIILVLYNQAALTLACLESLAESLGGDEVIIVDNASSDRTMELLDRTTGAKLIRNEKNLHFLRAVNQAAQRATGEYLVLLNNDARLFEGSLEAALAVFDAEDKVGAVGGRIARPDGTLQEAGSIVWSDGSCLGYGRDSGPDDRRYLFRRDVDFCSGAFLVTPRKLFDELGGFDEAYAPAYYEETDYCIRLHRAGYRIIYEPRAFIEHLEFGSSSHGAASELMQRNQRLFLERHGEYLRKHHYDPAPENVHVARSRAEKRVLVIDDRFPHRDLGQGFPRANHAVHEMVRTGAEVTVFATNQRPEPLEDLYRDLPPSVEMLCGSWDVDLRHLLVERTGFYDVLFVSRPHNMERVRELLPPGSEGWQKTKWIYDAEAIFADRQIELQRLKGRKPSRARQARIRAQELELADRADAVVAVTRSEADKFREGTDAPVSVLGTSVELGPGEADYSQRQDFLFVGALTGDETPNADSLIWFLSEVWPIVRSTLPEARFRIAGLNESPEVKRLAHHEEHVELLGKLPDLSATYNEARVFVAPTRYAGGLPLKCVEAASAGLPQVVTPLLQRQLGWRPEEELMCAPHTEPEEFASACISLYRNAELWKRLRNAALERVAREYSRERFSERIRELLQT